jgi:uncharacterized protein (TIGR02271 family)
MANQSTPSGSAVGDLQSLDAVPDFKVADGEPDIRGWKVTTSDQQNIGTVKDLLVDINARKVRYLCVEVDSKFANASERDVLIPIGVADLDRNDDRVLLSGITSAQVPTLPKTAGRNFDRQYEESVARSFGATRSGGYSEDLYDDSRIRGSRNAESKRVTRSEEELAIGKRAVQSGEVNISKHVETEHVSEKVPITREEVTVERRPPSGNADARIEGDEIRVPLMAEEVVAEKRVVPKEEVVIKKRAVQDDQTVEGDVRKERIDVKGEGIAKSRVKEERIEDR